MILVIGGMGAGKRGYVKALGYTDADISTDVSSPCPVIYGVERLAFDDPDGCMALLPELIKKEIVVCAEVGNGVIPVIKSEREGREAAGRLAITLAAQASRVVRLVCGIPTVIKERQ